MTNKKQQFLNFVCVLHVSWCVCCVYLCDVCAMCMMFIYNVLIVLCACVNNKFGHNYLPSITGYGKITASFT